MANLHQAQSNIIIPLELCLCPPEESNFSIDSQFTLRDEPDCLADRCSTIFCVLFYGWAGCAQSLTLRVKINRVKLSKRLVRAAKLVRILALDDTDTRLKHKKTL